jgi:hypothetical protein
VRCHCPVLPPLNGSCGRHLARAVIYVSSADGLENPDQSGEKIRDELAAPEKLTVLNDSQMKAVMARSMSSTIGFVLVTSTCPALTSRFRRLC